MVRVYFRPMFRQFDGRFGVGVRAGVGRAVAGDGVRGAVFVFEFVAIFEFTATLAFAFAFELVFFGPT